MARLVCAPTATAGSLAPPPSTPDHQDDVNGAVNADADADADLAPLTTALDQDLDSLLSAVRRLSTEIPPKSGGAAAVAAQNKPGAREPRRDDAEGIDDAGGPDSDRGRVAGEPSTKDSVAALQDNPDTDVGIDPHVDVGVDVGDNRLKVQTAQLHDAVADASQDISSKWEHLQGAFLSVLHHQPPPPRQRAGDEPAGENEVLPPWPIWLRRQMSDADLAVTIEVIFGPTLRSATPSALNRMGRASRVFGITPAHIALLLGPRLAISSKALRELLRLGQLIRARPPLIPKAPAAASGPPAGSSSPSLAQAVLEQFCMILAEIAPARRPPSDAKGRSRKPSTAARTSTRKVLGPSCYQAKLADVQSAVDQSWFPLQVSSLTPTRYFPRELYPSVPLLPQADLSPPSISLMSNQFSHI